MKYANIVFMQNSEAMEILDIINKKSPYSAIKYLSQWDFGKESENDITENEPWGNSDRIYKYKEYILSWNPCLEYVGLTRIVSKVEFNFKKIQCWKYKKGSEHSLPYTIIFKYTAKNNNGKNIAVCLNSYLQYEHIDIEKNVSCGTRISFESLPKNMQYLIKKEYIEIWEEIEKNNSK